MLKNQEVKDAKLTIIDVMCKQCLQTSSASVGLRHPDISSGLGPWTALRPPRPPGLWPPSENAWCRATVYDTRIQCLKQHVNFSSCNNSGMRVFPNVEMFPLPSYYILDSSN